MWESVSSLCFGLNPGKKYDTDPESLETELMAVAQIELQLVELNKIDTECCCQRGTAALVSVESSAAGPLMALFRIDMTTAL